MSEVCHLDVASDGVVLDHSNIVKVRHVALVGQKGKGIHDLIRKAHVPEVVRAKGRVLHDVVEKSDAGPWLIPHLLGKVKGVGGIRDASLVHLPGMGIEAYLERLVGHRRVQHGGLPAVRLFLKTIVAMGADGMSEVFAPYVERTIKRPCVAGPSTERSSPS